MSLSQVLSLLLIVGNIDSVKGDDNIEGPRFVEEPPNFLEFSNNTGAKLRCLVSGRPHPTVTWVLTDGSMAVTVLGLREIQSDGSLVFLPFKAENYRQDVHSVVHRCIASNPAGVIVSREAHVKAVMAASYVLHVYDAFAMMGNVAVLKCHIPSFLGSYVIITAWIKDNSLRIEMPFQDDKYAIASTGELLVSNVGGGDTGSTYTCEGFHRLTKEVMRSVTAGRLFVTEPKGNVPPKFIEIQRTIVIDEDKEVKIPCVAQGFPLPAIKWYMKSAVGQLLALLYNDRIIQTKFGLVIRNAKTSDSGTYVCLADNVMGSEQTEITVTVAVPLSVRVIPNEVTLEKNVQTELRCIASGSPLPFVTWFHNGQPINSNTRLHASSEFIEVYESGMYQCFASNDHEMVQDTAQVNAGELAPSIISGFTEKTLRPGSEITLNCDSSGTPLPDIKWMVDSKPLVESPRFSTEINAKQRNYSSGKLRIKNLQTEDGGYYHCVAANIAGKAEYGARINVYGKLGIRKMQKGVAISGQEFFITCPYFGYPVENIIWKKDWKELPYDPRQIVHLNGTLIVEAIERNEDQGKYTCTITNQQGESVSEDVDVIVIVAPKIVPFAFQQDSLREGMRARLQCAVSEGDSPLTIRWIKDGNPLPSNQGLAVRQLDEFSSILTFSSLSPSHNGNYTCVATNDAAVATHSAKLSVNVPPRWLREPNDTAVLIGKEVQIPCLTEGHPPPSVKWMKAEGSSRGNRIQIYDGPNMRILLNGSLQIQYADLSHQGHYFCQASNGIGKLGKMIHLLVHTPPSFAKKSENRIVRKGSQVQLLCIASGDKPIYFTWMTQGEVLRENRNSRYTLKASETNYSSSSQLTISNTQKIDDTVFICSAKNAFGADELAFHVSVTDVPDPPKQLQISSNSNGTVGVTWNSPKSNNSPLVRYTLQYKESRGSWEKGVVNQTVDAATPSAFISGLKPAVKYHVRVIAENGVGFSEPSDVLEVNVAEQAPNAPPQNLSVIATDSDSLKVTWQPPKKEHWNGVIRGYYVGYKIAGTSDPFSYKLLEVPEDYINTLSLSISDLHKFTQYSIIVQAFNDGGKGPTTKEMLTVTSESVPTKPPTNIRCSVLSSQSIHVTWNPPPSHSIHGVLNGYKLMYRLVENNKGAIRSETKTISTTKASISNLQKFSNYSVQILAFTRRGDGVKSDPVYCKTMEDIPDKPADIKALPSSHDSILISWLPPKHPNGIINKYTIYVKNSRNEKDMFKQSVRGNTTLFEMTGLRKNDLYEMWVTASTALGEGERSRIVMESPGSSKVAAKMATFGSTVISPVGENVKLPCRAVGIPPAAHHWTSSGNPLAEDDRIEILSDGSLFIRSIQKEDAGNYTCLVHNDLGRDKTTHAVIIQKAPGMMKVEISLTTTSSIDLEWKAENTGNSPLLGYTLYYKHEDGEWKVVNLDPSMDSYRLESLHCGTKYQLYLLSYNKIGKGEPTPVLTASTKGGVPVAPTLQALLEEGMNFISLNLGTWVVDKCPIKYFVVEYKPLNEDKWRLYSDDISPDKQKVVVSNLLPGTWYILRMVAHSSAGSVAQEYIFATLTPDGVTVLPGPVADQPASPGILLRLSDVKLLLPVVGGLVVIAVGITIACICVRRTSAKRNPGYDVDKSLGSSPLQSNYSEGSLTYVKGNSRFSDQSGDPTPYATAKLSDFHSDEISSFNCRNSSGHHSLPGTLPIYTQFPRPATGTLGHVHGPNATDIVKFRGHLQQLPTAPPMSDSYYPSASKSQPQVVCTPSRKPNSKTGGQALPPLPKMLNQRLLRADEDPVETTFIFPGPIDGTLEIVPRGETESHKGRDVHHASRKSLAGHDRQFL